MTFGLITIDYKPIVRYDKEKINIYTNEVVFEDKKYGDTLRIFKMKTNKLAISLNNKLDKAYLGEGKFYKKIEEFLFH